MASQFEGQAETSSTYQSLDDKLAQKLTPVKKERKRQVSVRLEPDEWDKLDAIAKSYDAPMGATVAQLALMGAAMLTKERERKRQGEQHAPRPATQGQIGLNAYAAGVGNG